LRPPVPQVPVRNGVYPKATPRDLVVGGA
jgi:hypothetical protein